MRRLFDVALIALVLAAVGIGAYVLGHHVDHLSNQAASQDSELSRTTTASAAAAVARKGHSHVTPLFVGGAVVAVLAAFAIASLVSATLRSRRRQALARPLS